jgi:hypothetical protein
VGGERSTTTYGSNQTWAWILFLKLNLFKDEVLGIDTSIQCLAGGGGANEHQSPYFKTFMEPRNRFQGINSASLCSLAGRYFNPIPTRFLAPIDCLKIPAQIYEILSLFPFKDINKRVIGEMHPFQFKQQAGKYFLLFDQFLVK